MAKMSITGDTTDVDGLPTKPQITRSDLLNTDIVHNQANIIRERSPSFRLRNSKIAQIR